MVVLRVGVVQDTKETGATKLTNVAQVPVSMVVFVPKLSVVSATHVDVLMDIKGRTVNKRSIAILIHVIMMDNVWR